MFWLNKDIANILKEMADPITYGRLLCVARIFHPESQERYVKKLREYSCFLRDYRRYGYVVTRSKTKKINLVITAMERARLKVDS